jgi:hypothetical protein
MKCKGGSHANHDGIDPPLLTSHPVFLFGATQRYENNFGSRYVDVLYVLRFFGWGWFSKRRCVGSSDKELQIAILLSRLRDVTLLSPYQFKNLGKWFWSAEG